MAEVKLTIPDDKVQRVIAALTGLYPIPTDKEGEPLFSPVAWSKEALRRWLIGSVQRWETKVARDAVIVPAEDELVS